MCLHFHVASACVLGFGTCILYFSAEDGGEERERGRREEEEEDQKEKKEATNNSNHVDIAQQYNNRAMKGVGSPESWLLVLNEVERQACWAPRHIPQTL